LPSVEVADRQGRRRNASRGVGRRRGESTGAVAQQNPYVVAGVMDNSQVLLAIGVEVAHRHLISRAAARGVGDGRCKTPVPIAQQHADLAAGDRQIIPSIAVEVADNQRNRR
jgi:hypothetical protein